MSHSQFHCTGRVYLDMHGLIFETSICYWQDQPGSFSAQAARSPRVTVPSGPLSRRSACAGPWVGSRGCGGAAHASASNRES